MAKGDVLIRMKADVGNYNANLAAANRTLKNFREENLSLGGVVKNMTRSFTGYAAGLMSIGAVAGKLHETVTEAVQLAKSAEGVRMAFNRLNDPSILDGLRQATHGTVTDVELMKAAVKFNDFKLPLNELGTMLAFAQQKAKDTGQSVDYMVDSIVTGLGRKSKPILDNLGISATEIDEKMKQTGDMTKAVGEIIREQMSKAGNYVETAADRAAQANVSIQNKLEELGRKFAPLEEASSNLWTSMKLGILDVISGPLTSLLNTLTRAGRMMNAYNMMGGDSAVNTQIQSLAGSDNQRETYFQQMNTYRATNIGLNRAIGAIQAWQGGDRSEAARRAMENAKQTYGLTSLNTAPLRAALDANMKQMEEYKKKALAILEPVNKAITDPMKGDGKGGKAKKIKAEEILPVGSVAALTKEIQELRTEQSKVTTTSEWEKYSEKIDAVTDKIKELKGELGIDALRNVKPVSVNDMIKNNMPTRDKIIKMGQEAMDNFKAPEPEKRDTLKDTRDVVSGLQNVSSGLQQMGVKLPEGVQKVIGVVQGLMTVIQGVQTILNVFTTTTSSAQVASLTANTSVMAANTSAIVALTGAIATNTATNLIPFASGGVVKAAGGYRVPGRTFSGDMVPARLNAGELVLNQAQAGVIANALQDREFGGGSMMQPYVDGEKIFLGMNNTSKRMGRGEIVTTSTLRRLGLM